MNRPGSVIGATTERCGISDFWPGADAGSAGASSLLYPLFPRRGGIARSARLPFLSPRRHGLPTVHDLGSGQALTRVFHPGARPDYDQKSENSFCAAMPVILRGGSAGLPSFSTSFLMGPSTRWSGGVRWSARALSKTGGPGRECACNSPSPVRPWTKAHTTTTRGPCTGWPTARSRCAPALPHCNYSAATTVPGPVGAGSTASTSSSK